jgi:hypothetical protein
VLTASQVFEEEGQSSREAHVGTQTLAIGWQISPSTQPVSLVHPNLHWPVAVSHVRPAPHCASVVHLGLHTLSRLEHTMSAIERPSLHCESEEHWQILAWVASADCSQRGSPPEQSVLSLQDRTQTFAVGWQSSELGHSAVAEHSTPSSLLLGQPIITTHTISNILTPYRFIPFPPSPKDASSRVAWPRQGHALHTGTDGRHKVPGQRALARQPPAVAQVAQAREVHQR